MVLDTHQFIGGVSDQVGFEAQVEWNVQSNVSAEGQACKLDESDPFQNSCVFVDDLTLFEVQL